MKAHGHLFIFFRNMLCSCLKSQLPVPVYNSSSFSPDAVLTPYQCIVVWMYCYFLWIPSTFALPHTKMYIYIIHISAHNINTYILLFLGHIYTYFDNTLVLSIKFEISNFIMNSFIFQTPCNNQ